MRQPQRKRAKKPSNNGQSLEVWEAIGKALPGIVRAVAALIEALKLH